MKMCRCIMQASGRHLECHKLQQLQFAAQIVSQYNVHTWHDKCRTEDTRALMAHKIIRLKAGSNIAGNNECRLEYFVLEWHRDITHLMAGEKSSINHCHSL